MEMTEQQRTIKRQAQLAADARRLAEQVGTPEARARARSAEDQLAWMIEQERGRNDG